MSGVETPPSPTQRAKDVNRHGERSAVAQPGDESCQQAGADPAGFGNGVSSSLPPSSKPALVYAVWMEDHCLLPGMLPEGDLMSPAVTLLWWQCPQDHGFGTKAQLCCGEPSMGCWGPTWGLPVFARVSHHLKRSTWGTAHGPDDFSLWKSKCDASPDEEQWRLASCAPGPPVSSHLGMEPGCPRQGGCRSCLRESRGASCFGELWVDSVYKAGLNRSGVDVFCKLSFK